MLTHLLRASISFSLFFSFLGNLIRDFEGQSGPKGPGQKLEIEKLVSFGLH